MVFTKHTRIVLLLLIVWLSLCCIGNCQTTTITGTVTDTDGQTWNNGTISGIFQLIPNFKNISDYSINGVPLTLAGSTFSGTLSGSGTFSIAGLYTNSLVFPIGSSWSITICPRVSAPCQTLPNIMLTGGTQSLTSFITASITAPRFNALYTNSFGSYGYLDTEVNTPPMIGAVYYNVTNLTQRIWTGSAWANNGSGGGGSGVPSVNGITNAVTIVQGTQHNPLGVAGANVIVATPFLQVDAINDIGLDNTGATDVTAPLATFLTVTPTNGEVIRFPCGLYKFASQLTISATATTKNNLVFKGVVPASQQGVSCVQFEDAAGADMIEYNNTTSATGQQRGPTFEDIGFTDSSGTGAMHSGLHLVQANNTILKNVSFTNFSGSKYSTGTVSISGTAVTGAGTTFTSAMAGGLICVLGNCQEVLSFTDATHLVLVSSWQYGTPSGSAFALDYNGIGVLLDGGTGFSQYGEWSNVGGQGNRITIASLGSNSSATGVSRITVNGGYSNCNRVSDSMYSWFGGFTDTMTLQGVKENNCTWFAKTESAHANLFLGVRGENTGAFAPNSTCAGSPSQACTGGIDFNSDATNKSALNSVIGSYFNLVGNALQIDSDNVLHTTWSSNTMPSGVNTNNHFFLTSGAGKTTTYATDWDFNQITTGINTGTHCTGVGTGANPSVVSCSAAPTGFFSCATNASTGTCIINTSLVTANSTIQIQPDASLGTALSVTCNTTADSGLTAPRLASRVAATSFTINLGTFTTNPECFSYIIIN